MDEQTPVLILIALFVGALLVPTVGLARPRLAYPLTLTTLFVYALLSANGLVAVIANGPIRYHLAGWKPPIGIELNLDHLSAFVVGVLATISLLVSVYARVVVRRELGSKEMPFYTVMLIMLVGLNGMVLTGDLFNLYVFFEISSLSGYALMALGHRKAAVSAYRYLLMGTVGASFYLIGVAYLYALTGSLNMADVAERIPALHTNPALLLSIVFVVVGLGLKMALFPMHLWLPDAYTYASSTATAIIAPVMTKVSAYVLIRVLYFVYDVELFHEGVPIGAALTWLGVAGAVVGSVMAIAQKDLKRMLAYSSVSQVAYIAVGIGLANHYALIGAMLHVLNHAVMKCCLFLIAGHIALQTGSTRIVVLDGLGRRMPWTFFAFTASALAMIGLPPTGGFFSKWYIVIGGIDAGQWPVVVVVVASSLLTAVYFFRLLIRIYTAPEPEDSTGLTDPVWSMRLPVVVLGALVILFGLFNVWFVSGLLEDALPEALRVVSADS